MDKNNEFAAELYLLQNQSLQERPLRMSYENEVHKLKKLAEELLKQGYRQEDVARTLHGRRRTLGAEYKKAAPPILREYIYAATAKKYGDPLGPSFEQLSEYKSFQQIIESSSHPIRDIRTRLTPEGFEKWYNENSDSFMITERLMLRPWHNRDAEELYELAKDPRVGPAAGWAVHTSVEHSRAIIKEVLSAKETYAVVLKRSGNVIGSIGLLFGENGNLPLKDNEAEIGYWSGVPYWGQGLAPEAAMELIRHSFEELGLDTLWCAYYAGNEKSMRVAKKCGFIHHHTEKDVACPLINDVRTEHFNVLTKKMWQKQKT